MSLCVCDCWILVLFVSLLFTPLNQFDRHYQGFSFGARSYGSPYANLSLSRIWICLKKLNADCVWFSLRYDWFVLPVIWQSEIRAQYVESIMIDLCYQLYDVVKFAHIPHQTCHNGFKSEYEWVEISLTVNNPNMKWVLCWELWPYRLQYEKPINFVKYFIRREGGCFSYFSKLRLTWGPKEIRGLNNIFQMLTLFSNIWN